MNLYGLTDREGGIYPRTSAGVEQGSITIPMNTQGELEGIRDKLLAEINRLKGENNPSPLLTATPCMGGMAGLFSEKNMAYLGDQIVKNINEDSSWGWISRLIGGQGRGLLYGVGTAALLGILFPTLGEKFRAIVIRTALEGLELVQETRSLVERAKEDIEDLIAEAGLRG